LEEVELARYFVFLASISAAAALLGGCGGSWSPISAPGASLTTAKAKMPQHVYVTNTLEGEPNWAGAVDIYPAARNGNISPSTVISGSQTQLGEVNGVVVNDSGEIYVVSTDSNKIVGFAAGSKGNASPNVVISGSNTGLDRPTGMAIDQDGDLYVANCASGCGYASQPSGLLEFAADSNGNDAPTRVISGSETEIEEANDAALDAAGNIYVVNSASDSIVVFGAGAVGDAPPSRVISGSKTRLDGPEGIAVDSHGLYAGGTSDDILERFAAHANGNVPPKGVISGKKTRLGNVDGIAVDDRGDVYTANPNKRSIVEFAPLASGNVHPLGKIAGSNTKLVAPEFVFVR
jgi:sugar lactone lactonase YvrE